MLDNGLEFSTMNFTGTVIPNNKFFPIISFFLMQCLYNAEAGFRTNKLKVTKGEKFTWPIERREFKRGEED